MAKYCLLVDRQLLKNNGLGLFYRLPSVPGYFDGVGRVSWLTQFVTALSGRCCGVFSCLMLASCRAEAERGIKVPETRARVANFNFDSDSGANAAVDVTELIYKCKGWFDNPSFLQKFRSDSCFLIVEQRDSRVGSASSEGAKFEKDRPFSICGIARYDLSFNNIRGFMNSKEKIGVSLNSETSGAEPLLGPQVANYDWS